MSKSHYKKSLKLFTSQFNRYSTSGEIKLWCEVLRSGKFYGYQFNRQLPIGKYIADFVSRKLKLIIIIDKKNGRSKLEEERKRVLFMKSQGYQVLNITEYELNEDLANVIRKLEQFLPEIDSDHD